MTDAITLTNLLYGKVGLYEGYELNADKVASKHKRAELHLSDAHKLLSPDKLKALGPNLALQTAPVYVGTETYDKGQVVKQDQSFFKSRIDDNQGNVVTDAQAWEPTTLLSAWYDRIVEGAIKKLSYELSNVSAAQLICKQISFISEGKATDTIAKSGRFLGQRFTLQRPGISLSLNRIGQQFNSSVDGVPVYVFHSSQATPIAIGYFTANAPNRTIWFDSNLFMFYREGGFYEVGIYESDLDLLTSSITNNLSFQASGCAGCLGPDFSAAVSRNKYVKIEPFSVSSANIGTKGLRSWTGAQEVFVDKQNWGFNFQLSVECDRQPMLVNYLLYAIAADVLEEISVSDRVNAINAQLKNMAYVALNGQANTKSDFGVKGKLNEALKTLKNAFASNNCEAVVEKKNYVEFGSMWD